MHLFVRIVERREFLIFLFTFDAFLLICFTNCFYRTIENYLNYMYIMNNEKIYVDNESSDICLIKNVCSRMTRSHYGSRSCRALRELKHCSVGFFRITLFTLSSRLVKKVMHSRKHTQYFFQNLQSRTFINVYHQPLINFINLEATCFCLIYLSWLPLF
jgi:hypothetical protein